LVTTKPSVENIVPRGTLKKNIAMRKAYLILILLLPGVLSLAQDRPERNKFSQLYEELPTPNVYRTASGAPGHKYWQQKADYKISIELNDDTQSIKGAETITYHNNSPDPLDYLWLQLDQNMRAKDSDRYKISGSSISEKTSTRTLKGLTPTFDGGFKIDMVQTTDGKPLAYTVVKTMMRVDLPTTLVPGKSFSFYVSWHYNINNRAEIGGRSGYEYFEEDGNYLYTIAQFFPRMAVYSDDEGWQHKQFLGRGEFTLPFGDYEVEIKVPSDHLVAATGELQNAKQVLSKKEMELYEKARNERKEPVIISNQKTAEEKEKQKASGTKTWKFKANNVRDFAFASSRKFIWDAMGVEMSDGRVVMAMSMYPKEGNPLWEKYSTRVVAHTLRWYSHYTFDYPYPLAWSIHTNRIGMEYPMICFNGGRPESDGTYSKRTKYGLIGVIIHEVGHNFFPMIVNSDERQWTWMDEGLNTFVQFLTEQQWEEDYPSRRGPAEKIVDYMKGDKSTISPIMTNSESLFQFGANAYAKPATALNILRETIMGRELFDFAFKTYATRWKFKHPSPADFFRTMEDASAVDLDWFWWGWFYTTDHVDLAIKEVKAYQIENRNPDEKYAYILQQRANEPVNISIQRNKASIEQYQQDIDPVTKDFYNSYDPEKPTEKDYKQYENYLLSLTEEDKEFLENEKYYYELTFENLGGLVMPIIFSFKYEDGSEEEIKLPAEVWKMNNKTFTKVFPVDKPVKGIILDPNLETADVDRSNNYYPARQEMSRFELFNRERRSRKNPMQD
jgi:hypothetical protein